MYIYVLLTLPALILSMYTSPILVCLTSASNAFSHHSSNPSSFKAQPLPPRLPRTAYIHHLSQHHSFYCCNLPADLRSEQSPKNVILIHHHGIPTISTTINMRPLLLHVLMRVPDDQSTIESLCLPP